MCDPGLRLAVVGVLIPRLRVRTVLACNLGKERDPGCNFDNAVDLLRALLVCAFLAAATEIKLVLRKGSGQHIRNE